jgi:hypothetical protein
VRTALLLLLSCAGGADSGAAPDTAAPDFGRGQPVEAPSYDDCAAVDPSPAALLDTTGLWVRQGTLTFVDSQGNTLEAYTWRPDGLTADSPVLFFLHEHNEWFEGYLEDVYPVAERAGALLIAPAFTGPAYEDWNDFVLGVGGIRAPWGGEYDPSDWRDPEGYVYSEVEHLFEAVRGRMGLTACGYRLFGESAGAQFVERLLLLRPDARVERAVAARGDWYTLPSDGGGGDAALFWPYGLQGSPVTGEQVAGALGRGLVALVGDADDATPDVDPHLSDSAEAMAQGASRIARAEALLAVAGEEASAMGVGLGWSLALAPGAGGSLGELAASAGWLLFEEDGAGDCAPTAAGEASLVFNELLADPPVSDIVDPDDPSPPGDANGDGEADVDEDAFVEIVNVGGAAVCLSGWTLSDGDEARHLFPMGSALAPGEALVVFGGGVPIGDFGGARVQWAGAGGRLSLSGGGDVLTLADADGAAALQVSWGDCGGRDCAADHYERSLYFDASLTRWPDLTGPWSRTPEVIEGGLYSPGTRADGAAF